MEGQWFRQRSEVAWVGEYPPKIAGLIDKLRQLKRGLLGCERLLARMQL